MINGKYSTEENRIQRLAADEEIVLFDVTAPIESNSAEKIFRPFSHFPFLPEKY
jgi:hypothetical protein